MNQSGFKKKKRFVGKLRPAMLAVCQELREAGSEPSIQSSLFRLPLTQTHRPQWKKE